MSIIDYKDFLSEIDEIEKKYGVRPDQLWITKYEWEYLKYDYRTYNNCSENNEDLEIKAVVSGIKIHIDSLEMCKIKNKPLIGFAKKYY